jgi:hypothetical protein
MRPQLLRVLIAFCSPTCPNCYRWIIRPQSRAPRGTAGSSHLLSLVLQSPSEGDRIHTPDLAANALANFFLEWDRP